MAKESSDKNRSNKISGKTVKTAAVIFAVLLAFYYSFVLVALLFCFNPEHRTSFDQLDYLSRIPFLFIVFLILFLVAFFKFSVSLKFYWKMLLIGSLFLAVPLFLGRVEIGGINGCLTVENFLYSTRLDLFWILLTLNL